MEILACPVKDCRSQLDLDVFSSRETSSKDGTVEEIEEGLITCPKCHRWYPVIEGIACMLPDDLRLSGKQRIEETAFLERWRDRIPTHILEDGRPFGLQPQS
ncbi:MAG: hypothetical protein HXY34_09655 [Candidatus Thorarchaeota archaeon]|nr:hypothetical protein [Candidatus Thorarchaeota archaeon]